jgi:DNA-binding beta-propeller fold protein YncE
MMARKTIVGITLLLAAGCSPKAMTFLQAPEPPIVWPLPPDAPRVRYVGELTGAADIGQAKSFGEVWDEILYGPTPPARLVTPHAVAVDAAGEKVAVADVNGKCVHVFDLAARRYNMLVQVGAPAGEQAASASRPAASAPADELRFDRTMLESPVAVCWAGDRLWVADSRQGAVAIFEPGGAGRWIALDRLKRPAGLAYCPANQLCYVSDAATHRLMAFDARGELLVEFGSRGGGPGQFNGPTHVACGPDGTLVVSDSLNFRVQTLGLDGSPVCAFGRKGDAAGDLALPKGVALDAAGRIWVVDAQFENVQAFTPEGRLLMSFGTEGHNPGEFWLPAGLCIDAKSRMWVADRENGRVQVFALLP